MQPTAEQRDAIHIHDSNLIVVAGAGSGKTRVLVERYLQLLAANPGWPIGALVAITFTREAAYEMRQRVREALEERAAADTDSHWARHLNELDRARIDTIHGLCADILRANAAVAGIDPQFEVLDEVEAAILLAELVEDLRFSIKAPLAQLFAQYDAYEIVDVLNQPALVNYEGPPLPVNDDALLRRWEMEWRQSARDARDRLLRSEEVAAVTELEDLPADDKLGDLLRRYHDWLRQLAAEEAADKIAGIIDACRLQGAAGNKGTVTAWGGKARRDEARRTAKDLHNRVKGALGEIGEPIGDIERDSAAVLPLWQGLLAQAREAYRARKQERALLDFDDLERLTAEVLRDESARARYRDGEFKQLLVDEFQDTNEAQWRIIEALAGAERGGSLFLVGDPKQSIYQFRGADVSVFNRVRRQFNEGEAGRELALSTSFRSHKALTGQFNALFKQLLTQGAPGRAADYQVAFDKPMRAFRQDGPNCPAIELQLLDKYERDPAGDIIKGPRGRAKQRQADDMRRWEAAEIAERIEAMLAEEREVYDADERNWRPLRYGDIALLFQSLNPVTLYEEAFKERGIPYITIAGRGYYDRQEVWDMLDLLRFLHNPADDLSLATVLRAPYFAFSDDMLFALRLLPRENADDERPLSLWRALQVAVTGEVTGLEAADRPRLRFALETLGDLLGIAGRVTISQLLRRALEATNYAAILSGLPDGARRRGNIEKLLQLAEDSGKITLGKFSRYLADLSAREVREGEALLEPGNAVRLMTVHASKGLEFPLVILADASWQRRNNQPPIVLADAEHGLSCRVYDPESNKLASGFAHRRNLELAALKEAAERLRLLYVAATRARDYLLISGQVTQGKAGWKASGWLGQLLEALDLADLKREPRQTRDFAGARLAVRMPSAPPQRHETKSSTIGSVDLWMTEPDAIDAAPPEAPPLLQRLPARPVSAPRHITASQLAWLGNWRHGECPREQDAYRQRFRAEALYGVKGDHDGRLPGSAQVSPETIGLIVHELLRFSHFAPDQLATEAMIGAIAWGHGVTDTGELAEVMRDARALLRHYRESDTYRAIRSARAAGRSVYSELPFIYRTDKRVIHGVMDLLLEDASGAWRVIDYKTNAVAGDHARHARRYRLQLGIYAAAVQMQFALARPPRAFVHYLRSNETVELTSAECRAELSRLEATIGQIEATDA